MKDWLVFLLLQVKSVLKVVLHTVVVGNFNVSNDAGYCWVALFLSTVI